MPKFPRFSNRVNQITGSVFEKYRAKMVAQGQNLVKLHIGDTYMHPVYPLPLAESMADAHKDFNQYCDTFGVYPLRDVLRDKLQEDNALSVTRENVLMTAGATNALSISMMALVQPDDEVMILTPAWPFFFGMVKIAGGSFVEVLFYTELFGNPNLDIHAYLDKFISEKTVAIYVNTPNNPSGKVLSKAQLQQIASFAVTHDLWVVSDEAYDGLTFDGRPHHSIASFPQMFERTLTVFTFSKSFMFAGLRLGYVVGPEKGIKNFNKMMVHQLYSPATLSQYMMVEPVKKRHDWLPQVNKRYAEIREILMENLKVDFPVPEGTYFVFFPADAYLKGRDYWQLIEQCLDAGVSVAPGDSFGKDYHNYIRLCFTGETPERLKVGIRKLNEVLAL